MTILRVHKIITAVYLHTTENPKTNINIIFTSCSHNCYHSISFIHAFNSVIRSIIINIMRFMFALYWCTSLSLISHIMYEPTPFIATPHQTTSSSSNNKKEVKYFSYYSEQMTSVKHTQNSNVTVKIAFARRFRWLMFCLYQNMFALLTSGR